MEAETSFPNVTIANRELSIRDDFVRAANRRGRNIDQVEPVASAHATRACSGRG